MEKTWVFKAAPEEKKIRQLQGDLNINLHLSTLLVQRGVEQYDQAKSFFRPSLATLHDPFEMKGMDIAINRLNEAIFNKEKILIYGDYDVDGTTSVALVYNFLKKIYSNISTYIPDRYTEGYGISKKGVEWAKEIGATLVIALDCGIRANDSIAYAREFNIDFIVCDHHLPGDELPAAVAILDPKQSDCKYPYDELSGCGIGFKMLQAFCIQNGNEIESLYEYLDLVCVSIASDIVPMTGENRILAFFGLKKLNHAPNPGLKALMEKAGMAGEIDISKVVFGIGPRINAAGRIEHAKNAVDLLTQDTKENALVYAEKLQLDNLERRAFDEAITKEALEMIRSDGRQHEKKSTVLYKKDWHKGIIGIVASRCIERYYKPTIILAESNNQVTGSARSVNGFDIYQAISKCERHLIQFGGHRHAAGLTMEIDQVKKFREAFEHAVAESIEPDQLEPKLEIDLEIDLEAIDFKFFGILKQMGPFGPQNMQPVFCTKKVVLKSDTRLLKDKHLKLFLAQSDQGKSFDAIGFNLGTFHRKLDEPFDIAYTIEENNYMGKKTIQLNLKDIRI